ncbi:hypothetical protein HYV81_01910 [Candidatus Woesearchaeota archaeon]|nr:hypothetical protein [Candidatus Woesearchaeota archaeon]
MQFKTIDEAAAILADKILDHPLRRVRAVQLAQAEDGSEPLHYLAVRACNQLLGGYFPLGDVASYWIYIDQLMLPMGFHVRRRTPGEALWLLVSTAEKIRNAAVPSYYAGN